MPRSGRWSLASVGLLRTFTLQGAIDQAIQAAWIQALGSKRGTAKVGHLFCEMQLRLGLVGLGDADGLPAAALSQQELADYTGMTHVHLNRCLKELREAGTADLRIRLGEGHRLGKASSAWPGSTRPI